MIEVYTLNLDGTYFAVALNGQEIAASTFSADQKTAIENILASLPADAPFQVIHKPISQAKATLAALKDIYDGKDPNTDTELPLAVKHLPAYTQKVLKATAAIPAGYVTSYGAIAKAVGGGARAVGNVMASNPFPPIVPCHRVVKSDLGLGGYGAGGLGVKLEFLKREQRGYSEPREIDAGSGVLKIFPTELVVKKYC
jgi:O-6-methylguanine DNA methyltransferase